MSSGDDAGNVNWEIRPYLKTKPDNDPNFWSDLAVTSFALALIVEGIALVLSRRWAVVLFALVLTLAATLLNLGFVLGTYSQYGLARISALAVIFGVYMAIYQWTLLQSSRRVKGTT